MCTDIPGAEMDESDELHCEASFTYEVSIAEKQKYSSTTSMKWPTEIFQYLTLVEVTTLQ